MKKAKKPLDPWWLLGKAIRDLQALYREDCRHFEDQLALVRKERMGLPQIQQATAKLDEAGAKIAYLLSEVLKCRKNHPQEEESQ